MIDILKTKRICMIKIIFILKKKLCLIKNFLMSYQIAQCRYSLIHITPRAKKRWFDKKKEPGTWTPFERVRVQLTRIY